MTPRNTSIRKKYNWSLFFVIWTLVVFGLIAVIPYSLSIQAKQLQSVKQSALIDLQLYIQTLFNALLYGIITGIGLLLAEKYGLGLPFLEHIVVKNKLDVKFKGIIILSVIVGTFSALVIFGLEQWLFNLDIHLKQFGIEIQDLVCSSSWKGFLISFYGGITEEVLLRLFFLTFIVWILMSITGNKSGKPSLTFLWSANIIVAIVFGLGHLPTTVAIGIPLDSFVILRSVVLNGIGGIIFGWLYFTFGLESAMLAHFSADIILHVIL